MKLSNSIRNKATHCETPEIVDVYLTEQEQKNLMTSPKTLHRIKRGESLTIDDVIKLSQLGVKDPSIVNYIKKTKTGFQLNTTQTQRLYDNQVSERVIDVLTVVRE